MDVAISAEASAYPQSEADFACAEFIELAVSAGMDVVEVVKGSRKKPDPRTFVGRGKIDEIKLYLKQHEVDVVLFGQRLSPSQERNLERELEVRVLDRSSLILDIFAQRARSFEGKLQVELAQLTHLSTRLVRGWTHLERQKGGIGLRGPGEMQLETDRRLLGERVKVLKQRLTKVRRQRSQGRSKRSKSGTPTIALVGYTNAGKSTLFNRLTTAKVYAADQLFATLDPTMRRMDLPGGVNAVLADTVGFINDLPHELVEAFLSTLTETREADLLLHVVDANDELRENRREQVDLILDQIGASDVPQLMVFNKVDQTEFDAHVEHNEEGLPAAAWVSAINGDGIEGLLKAITDLVSRKRSVGWLSLLPSHGKLRAQLYEADAVKEEQIKDDGGLGLYIDIDAIDFTKLMIEHGLSDSFTPDQPASQ